MKLILCDINSAICDEWVNAFDLLGKPKSHVEVFQGRFEDITQYKDYNYIMTAAGNSFGVMGGGIDYAIAKFFPGVEAAVRRKIISLWNGELNVGAAIRISLKDELIEKGFWTQLIYSPTMRAPIDIKGTDNIYLAMKATLFEFDRLQAYYPNLPFVLVIPGFGGQCGNVQPKIVAYQMYLAYTSWRTKPIKNTTMEMRQVHNNIMDNNL